MEKNIKQPVQGPLLDDRHDTTHDSYEIEDHESLIRKNSKSVFWVTLQGRNSVPFTIACDHMDLEDFALQECGTNTSAGKYLASLDENDTKDFVKRFVDHITDPKRNGENLRVKLIIMGRIFTILAQDPIFNNLKESFAMVNYKIAGHALNIYTRMMDTEQNYGLHRVWIESIDIIDLDSLLQVYADIVANNAIRQIKN